MQRVLAALLIAGCGGSSGGHPDGAASTRCQNYTCETADIFGKTESQACAGHNVRVADDASTFRGDDSMEVYLR
jgi:hypothetical protein